VHWPDVFDQLDFDVSAILICADFVEAIILIASISGFILDRIFNSTHNPC
jgi:F0F1-type ATP synthase assembly protein I